MKSFRFAIILLILFLFSSIPALSDTTSATFAGTGADSNAVGTVTWSNPGNITAEDGAISQAQTGSAATTHYLRASNFGFAIPAGAIVTGITVEIKKKFQDVDAGVDSFAVDSAVKAVKADASVGSTNKADGSTHWATSLTYATYGSSSDVWGETWTGADVNDTDFGVVISGVTTNPSGDTLRLTVDAIRITLTYILPTKRRKPIWMGAVTATPHFVSMLD